MKPIKIVNIALILLIITICIHGHYYSKQKLTGKTTESFVGTFSARVDPGVRILDFTFNGSTTEFVSLNDTALETITNMTLEITGYGKIIWLETINLTQCAAGGVVDLDTYVNLTYNRTAVSISNLPCLNKSALLYLYDLPFTNIVILRNSAICPSSICTKISYTSGDLIFNVTQFTHYSGDEAPSYLRPNISQIFINSSLGTNLSTEDITAYVNMTDNANTSMLVYYNWYADGVLITSGTATVTNGTLTNISTVASINLVAGEIWTFEARGWDGEYNGTWTNATITILSPEAPPSAGGGGGGTSGESYARDAEEKPLPPAPPILPITQIPLRPPVKPAIKPIQQQQPKPEEAKPEIMPQKEKELSILLYFKQKGDEAAYLIAALLIVVVFTAVALTQRQQNKKKKR
jgi:hypothetical protein